MTREVAVAVVTRDGDHLLRVKDRELDRILDLDDRAEDRVVEAVEDGA